MAVDQRFYLAAAPIKLVDAVDRLGLQTDRVPDISISGISVFAEAVSGDLSFVDDLKLVDEVAGQCARGVICITTETIAERAGRPQGAVIAQAPRLAFFMAAEQMFTPRVALFDSSATKVKVHPEADVHPNAIIGDGVAIGPRTRIGPYVCIDNGVQIGSDCTVNSSAQIGFSLIGNGVEIGSGVRLGGAGFGLLPTTGGAKQTPHFGRVLVQDNVRIGANTCVDRGVLGDTIIGENTKIDNLCHIGHNTRIGRNVIMAAFAGVSGSVEVGDDVIMGGRVGIVDHKRIGKGARLGADAAVFADVPAGETWAGSPARPLRQWQRETVWLKRSITKRGKD